MEGGRIEAYDTMLYYTIPCYTILHFSITPYYSEPYDSRDFGLRGPGPWGSLELRRLHIGPQGFRKPFILSDSLQVFFYGLRNILKLKLSFQQDLSCLKSLCLGAQGTNHHLLSNCTLYF